MSWLRSAVNRAVEVGNKNNLTRAVKNYADSVIHQAGQAVAEGAKIFQERIVTRNYRSVKQTIKRLEEAAVSCRGPERVMLIKRWLLALTEIEKFSAASSEEKQQSLLHEETRKPSMVLYYDPDVGGEPMNFRDVFLQSQAMEGITISMILEAPNEEEISLLLVLFRLCLIGGKEVHNAIVSSIQDLATAFASYEDEVLAKREELLQFAQSAITGLKISADLARIDTEAVKLKSKLDEMNGPEKSSSESQEEVPDKATKATLEALKEALAQIRISSRLEGLLLRKKSLSFGDSPEVHAQKVDKLKVLSESLASSTTKAEKRILDHRLQKDEAVKVRVAKADEANEKEKEIAAEIAGFERKRDELEAELKKVNISLAAANARLRNAREERDQFEEANNQIIEHLKANEDELSKSMAASKSEADVLSTWMNFLEDTWVLHCSFTEDKEKKVNDELERHEEYFANLAIRLLSCYKKKLEPSISVIGKFVANLKNLSEGSEKAGPGNEDSILLNPKKHLEEEYLDHEAEIVTTFSVVDNLREQLYAQPGTIIRKDDGKINALFDDIEKLRHEFDSIERPNLEMEIPSPEEETPPEKPLEAASHPPTQDSNTMESALEELPKATSVEAENVLDPVAELAKLESEFGKDGRDYSADEIGDWEFDELERELRSS